MASREGKSDCIIFDDSYEGYSAKNFTLPEPYEKHISTILIPGGMVRSRLDRMSIDILNDYEKSGVKSVYIICILKGGFKFASDLFKTLQKYSFTRDNYIKVSIDFVVASTYVDDSVGHDTNITPCTNMEKFRDKDVLIVEDMVDTGTSLNELERFVRKYEPKSVYSACFSSKKQPITFPGYKPTYVGFEVPNVFIVGYGIDYNDQFRELPHVCAVNDEGKREFLGKG
ncbi:hypoxanthine-guanine phosphoribosyltransferase,putative [Schistosoma mansoni]|uniref:hypoxanthine-guanine phosphoribosyltransferase,putative n=1 Tax=Schistosoma mansoni TaxID=6183 RepID=UPI00022C838E|nr:hypoxanthine-guanine phosphoribosyltransferase,putative [Schistosoma mansoni]|eukprot:XP_018645681.1 hypoxanthine-guanine phosphoribosyltransferase,putative [Schistosoma mansoni]